MPTRTVPPIVEIDKATLYQLIGQRIRDARRAKDPAFRITQEKLADEIGVERTSISNIETGSQSVSLHVLYAISAYLRVPLTSLLPDLKLVWDPSKKPGHLAPEDDVPKSVSDLLKELDP